MLLENLYRVFFDSQKVALQDARECKIIWSGTARNIPSEYLNYTVDAVTSCAINKSTSEIVIIIV